jgi:DNA modification methylase
MLEIRPIVVNDEMIVLGGNMRLKACKEAGLKEIHIIKAESLTEEQQKEFIIKDNVGFGEWDWEQLANEWDNKDLDNWGLDVPDFEVEEEQAQDDDYEEPENIEELKTDIIEGYLITFEKDGKELHRLLCGDSTKKEDVEKLMNEKKADMVFTDPPYDLENENYHTNIDTFTKDAHVFVMHDDKGIVEYLRQSKLDFSRFYVANFGFSSPRGNDPYLSHILISQEKKGKAIPHKNMYDGFRSIIPMEYRFRLKDDKTEHKHQKPISFVNTFIEHFSNEENIILDLFLGSGTTMVSCNKTNRKCYGTELMPKYCQLIIDRMKNLDNELIVKINQKEYE